MKMAVAVYEEGRELNALVPSCDLSTIDAAMRKEALSEHTRHGDDPMVLRLVTRPHSPLGVAVQQAVCAVDHHVSPRRHDGHGDDVGRRGQRNLELAGPAILSLVVRLAAPTAPPWQGPRE